MAIFFQMSSLSKSIFASGNGIRNKSMGGCMLRYVSESELFKFFPTSYTS